MANPFFQFPWETRGYVRRPNLEAYVRITQRRINGTVQATLELGNVNVDPEARRSGVFKNFLLELENFAQEKGMLLIIENVHNNILQDFLRRRGYIPETSNPNTFLRK